MQEDKIFNNSYGEHDMTDNPVNFRLESSYEDSMDPDDKIHYEMMMKDVDRVILESEYCELNKVTPEGVSKKLNKIQINKVFYHVIKSWAGSILRSRSSELCLTILTSSPISSTVHCPISTRTN